MSTGRNDPRLLYSIGNIKAYHIQDGDESPLNPSGPQTLSLLMVPTSSSDDPSIVDLGAGGAEQDFYLHLHIPPELDLPLPAPTQIFHQPPRSYLIPRWDLGPDSGAFTRIEFPKIGAGPDRVTQEDIDTFETILAQCTAFLEKAQPPSGKAKPYNPAEYAPGEGYVGSGSKRPLVGQIVLIDEENGSVVGELSEGFEVVEVPVQIELPQEGQGNRINVSHVSEEYLRMSKHPAYKDSTIVQNAAMASRLIVIGSSKLADVISSGATAFTQKTKPNPKPLTFAPATQERIRKLNNLTHGAVGLSAATVGQLGKYAQNLGASLARRGEAKQKGVNKDGNARTGYKPGVLNKSMIAFSTIADGIEQGARELLTSGSHAASTMVGHRYGAEAGQFADQVAGGVQNVGLVYIDATGVSRKAVIKSVAKGMVVGRMPGGNQLMVGTGDGGQISPEMRAAAAAASSSSPLSSSGSAPPPAYSSAATGDVKGKR